MSNEQNMSNLEVSFYENLVNSRTSTINTRRAHLKKLKSINVEINNLNNDNIVDTLKQLQATSNKNGRRLSTSYMNIIYSTLRKVNPSLTISVSKLGFSRRGRFSINNPKDNIEVVGLKELIKTLFKYAITFNDISYLRIPSRAIADTAITVVLLLTTNLNFKQLMKLQVRHLKAIAYDDAVSIIIKSGNSTIKVEKISKSYERLFICIINMILSREDFIRRNFIVNNDVDVKYNHISFNDNDIDDDNNYCEEEKISKINDDDVRVISCKKDSINKTIHELYIRFHSRKPMISLGITLVKKIKDLLIDKEEIFSIINPN